MFICYSLQLGSDLVNASFELLQSCFLFKDFVVKRFKFLLQIFIIDIMKLSQQFSGILCLYKLNFGFIKLAIILPICFLELVELFLLVPNLTLHVFQLFNCVLVLQCSAIQLLLEL